jgi:hypothetical protein
VQQAISLLIDLLILAFTGFCAACHFNYPRFWWQELLCGATGVWLPLTLLLVVRAAIRLYRNERHGWISVLVAFLGSYTIGQSVMIAWPYLVNSDRVKLSKDEVIPVRILHAHSSSALQEAEALQDIVYQLHPDIVVVAGASGLGEIEISLRGRLSYVLHSADQSTPVIRLFSRFPLLNESRSELGLGALSGIYSKIALDDDVVFEFGAVSLQSSRSLDSFEQSRVTSRRLASLMRNSISPRMVVGDFMATPLSQIVSMYNRQARMRSVFYGQGVSTFARIQSVMRPIENVNAFVSAGVEVTDTRMVPATDGAQPSLFVAINVPRITVVPIER